MTSWLALFDDETGTIPVWDAPLECYELSRPTDGFVGDPAAAS